MHKAIKRTRVGRRISSSVRSSSELKHSRAHDGVWPSSSAGRVDRCGGEGSARMAQFSTGDDVPRNHREGVGASR